MAVVQTLIGNVKGPAGATGATGPQGVPGEAATINVGSVTTTAYGNPAQVTNSGTESDAVLDFVIPQGKPGQATTTMGGLTLDSITTSTADFPSPQVGDTGATAFGKIVKFFADALSALNSKLNTANVVNNLTTTEAGYALDARAGKSLNDSLTTGLENIVPLLFFGGYGKHYRTTKTSIDSAVNDTVSPTSDGDGFFCIDNMGQVPNHGNRQLIFGWINQQKTYGWCFACSFFRISCGRRNGASTFTLTTLAG